jgi:hypothetical protein
MEIVHRTWKKIFLENVSVKLLMLGMFFNPLGFDAVQYWLISLTGSLWYANLVLYFISGFFFGLSFLFKKYSK